MMPPLVPPSLYLPSPAAAATLPAATTATAAATVVVIVVVVVIIIVIVVTSRVYLTPTVAAESPFASRRWDGSSG